jgi:hypothetical protein
MGYGACVIQLPEEEYAESHFEPLKDNLSTEALFDVA